MSTPSRTTNEPPTTPDASNDTAAALAADLATAMRDHVRRSLGVELDPSSASLAFVDHYLRTVRSETRPEIVLLVAAEAGAWYGELVRREIGGTWIGDGRDPRALRLLLRHQFLHFAPVDQALEAVLAADNDEDDARVPAGAPLDTAFHAQGPGTAPRTGSTDAVATSTTVEDDASWLAARLAELPPIAEDEYYSLTCRFETLQLVLELLATKHVAEGRSPRELEVEDYTEVGVVGGSQPDASHPSARPAPGRGGATRH
jgi:hypothetical protein